MMNNQAQIGVGTKVIWRCKTCIVTNASIAAGKFIQISPVGNGNSPAKYYQIHPEDVKIVEP